MRGLVPFQRARLLDDDSLKDVVMPQRRFDILGVRVSAINLAMALATIDEWITQRTPNYACVTGAHGIVESRRDPHLRDIHNAAGLVTPDGVPLVWLARMMGFNHVERVYGPDLMLAVCESGLLRGYRHYFYGGAPGVPELLAQRLLERFPRLQVVGTYCPPFRALRRDEDIEIMRQISEAKPDILWVGLSTPKQERWMAEHVGRLGVPVLVGCGAAFDFIGEIKSQAPRWMMRAGLEWFYRMLTEPRRLGPRYLVTVPVFIGLVTRQLLRGRWTAADWKV